MKWSLPNDSKSKYWQVINLIVAGIQSRDLLPGKRLPAQRQLAQMLGVDRSTIQRALDELVSRGVLTSKLGSGTWVNANPGGLLDRSVNWNSYFDEHQMGAATNFMAQLQKLKTKPQVLNLVDNFNRNEALLNMQFNGVSWAALMAQNPVGAPSGALSLKNEVAKRFKSFLQQDIGDSQILITSGAQQVFYLMAQGLLAYGDAIAVEMPSYFYQLSLFRVAGIRVYGIPILDNGGLDLKQLEKLYYQHRFKFVFVNPNMQNPTTRTMPLAQREELVAACQKMQLPIVEDDPYGFMLAHDTNAITPLKKLDPGNVLYVGSLSEFSGEATRIGWLIAPAAIVQQLSTIRQEMESGISIFSQYAALQMFRHPRLEEIIQAQGSYNQQAFEICRPILDKLVNQGLISYAGPQNGSSVWVKILLTRPMTLKDYQSFLAQGVLVLPDFIFGAHQNAVRIDFTQPQGSDAHGFERFASSLLKLFAK